MRVVFGYTRLFLMIRVSCVALAVALSAGPVLAQSSGDIERAREQFRLGNDAYNAGNYEEAVRHFQEANTIAPNARLDLYIGQSYILLGQPGEALEHIQAYAASSSEARAEVADVIQQLEQAREEIFIVAQRHVDAAWRLAAGLPPDTGEAEIRDYTGVAVIPIQVRSNPAGASVYIDDENLGAVGRTPLDTELFVGPHHIIIKLDHYGTVRERINITSLAGGSIPIIDVDLHRENVQVEIEFNPMTARGVYISASGETIDLGMRRFNGELPAGEAVFLLQRSGASRRIERTLSAAGGVQRFTLNLDASDDVEDVRARVGTLIIRSEQAGVSITIDGTNVGSGVGEFDTQQSAGEHTIRVSRAGYETVEETVEVYEDERLRWTVPRLNRP